MEIGFDYRVGKITVGSAPCELGAWECRKVHLSQRGISIKRFTGCNVPAHEIDCAPGDFRIDASPCIDVILFYPMRWFAFLAREDEFRRSGDWIIPHRSPEQDFISG